MEIVRFLLALLGIATNVYRRSGTSTSKENVTKPYNLCTTNSCRDIALSVSTTLNRTAESCDNFYEYVCSKWIDNNPVNITFSQIDVHKLLEEKVSRQIIDILKDSPKPEDTVSLTKAKQLFAMCINEQSRNQGMYNIKRVMNDIDLWPIFMDDEEWIKKGYNTWQKVSDLMHKNLLQNGLYDITVGTADYKLGRNIIKIKLPHIYMDHIKDLDRLPKLVKEHYKLSLVNIFKRMVQHENISYNNSVVDFIVGNTVNFEVQLRKLIREELNRRKSKPSYITVSIHEWQQMYNARCNLSNCKINWYKVLSSLFASQGIEIKPSEKLQVDAHEYLMDLISLLAQTPFSIIANYMQWKFVVTILPAADMEFTPFIVMRQYDKSLSRHLEWLRWKYCVEDFNLFTTISHEYAKKDVPDNYTFYRVYDMINNIISIMIDEIHLSRSMNLTKKQVVLKKLRKMIIHIGPPKWYNNQYIDIYYHNLTITSNYLENIINLLKFNLEKKLAKLIFRVHENGMYDDSYVVHTDGYYDAFSNALIIPAAMLQDPIFDLSRPESMNYGSLGTIVSQILYRAFDLKYSEYTAYGYSTKLSCDDFSDDLFLLANVECIKKSNSSKVYGKNMRPKDIDDKTGIAAVYTAFKFRKVDPKEIRLLGIEEYSDDQLFFMGFAFRHCENFTPKKRFLKRLSNEVTVRNSLSNLVQFSTAYNCSMESHKA